MVIENFLIHGIGVSSYVQGIYLVLDNKRVPIEGPVSSHACSKRFPLRIYTSKNNPEEFFIFGDFQNPAKTYMYYHGMVSWNPMPDFTVE